MIQTLLAKKQRTWGWPVAGNFIVVGSATGYYILNCIAGDIIGEVSDLTEKAPFGLLAVVIAILGVVLVAAEAGRPLSGYQMIRNLRGSWMSREVIALVIFITAAVVDTLSPNYALRLLASAGALGLMISQGFIVYKSQSVVAWNTPVMPVFFLSSGFASGYGMMLLVGIPVRVSTDEVYFAGSFFVIFNIIVWLVYLRSNISTSFIDATKSLRHPIVTASIVGLGHILPLLLIGLFWMISQSQGFIKLPYIISLLMGLFLIMSVAAQKAGIILSAGYTKELASKT